MTQKQTLQERIITLVGLNTPQGMHSTDIARSLGVSANTVRTTLYRMVLKGMLDVAAKRGHYTRVRNGPPRGAEEKQVWYSAFGAGFATMACRYTSLTPGEACDAYGDNITTQALELAEAALASFRKSTTPSPRVT